MSLDYNYANVANKDEVIWDENDRMRPEVESMIFATMAVGINKITAENYEEFWKRYAKWSWVCGNAPFFDMAWVQKMIGLHTNASTITTAAFNKKLIERLDYRADSY